MEWQLRQYGLGKPVEGGARLGRNLRECLNIVHDLHSPLVELAVALLALFAHVEGVHARTGDARPRSRPG